MTQNAKSGSAVMDLTHGPVAKTLITFSIPFMLSTLLQTLYSTVDTIVVGQALGSAGLSGVSNGSQVMQLIYMLCIGFSNAGQVLIAQAKGAGNQEKVQRCVGTLFYIMTVISIALGGASVLFCHPLLELLSTPAEAYGYAADYILICGTGMIFTGFYNMFSAILRGMGDSRHPLIFVAIASGINLVLDVVFILALDMGVAGAAWATIIGQAASVIFSFAYLSRHGEELGFRFQVRRMKFWRQESSSMLKIGIPMAIQSGAIQVSFLFVSHLVNELGVAVSAAFGVAQKLRNIPGILTQGLSLGAGSMLGQNLGAGETRRVSSTVKCGIWIAAAINGIFAVLFLCAPVLCFRLFTQDATVLAYASMSMVTLVIELPGRCFMPSCNALISAQGNVKLSMVIAFVDAFAGRVFLSWFLGTALGLGAFGYFLGYSLATYLTAIPGFVYFASGQWKKRAALV